MDQNDLAQIESALAAFVRASYPQMVVRVELWNKDPSKLAVYFIDERFRGLYPRQRYHYLIHLIPKGYFDSTLADALWFELTPDQHPEDAEEDPDEEMIASITPDVIGALKAAGFFEAMDEILLTQGNVAQPQKCNGDFSHAKDVLVSCGFEEPDWSDIFHVLMAEGAFCDCEILLNAATESRPKATTWQRIHDSRIDLPKEACNLRVEPA